MARHKNSQWNLPDQYNGLFGLSIDHAQLAVLMDIRDELQAINITMGRVRDTTQTTANRLDCWETKEIPRILKKIRANTAKPRKKKRK